MKTQIECNVWSRSTLFALIQQVLIFRIEKWFNSEEDHHASWVNMPLWIYFTRYRAWFCFSPTLLYWVFVSFFPETIWHEYLTAALPRGASNAYPRHKFLRTNKNKQCFDISPNYSLCEPWPLINIMRNRDLSIWTASWEKSHYSICRHITKTCLYNFDLLKPQFYIDHRLWVFAKAVLTSTHNICFEEQKYEKYQSFFFIWKSSVFEGDIF